MSKVSDYVKYIKDIADDNSHGYAQDKRNGDPDFDCSSLVCYCVNKAGIDVKKYGASYTGDMYCAFIKAGFVDVTKNINLSNGFGLVVGDILLTPNRHTAIYTSTNMLTEASGNEKGTATKGKAGDQTGKEIYTHKYYNYPWKYVLRYKDDSIKIVKNTQASSNKTTSNNIQKKVIAKNKAMHFNKSIAGTYVTTSNLNLRDGSGTDKKLLVTVPKGKKVTCHGYYNMLGSKWLYVEYFGKNDILYTGFVCSLYLKKVK